MTFLVDANVVLYSAIDSDYREPCLEILDAIAAGAAQGVTSTAVFEEVWHVERSGRAGDLDGLTKSAYSIFSPLLVVTDEAFARALSLATPRLGTNDRLHAATCLTERIRAICTADRDFDAVRGLRRVDPLDARARRRMLAGDASR